jgi:peptide chain release factor 2
VSELGEKAAELEGRLSELEAFFDVEALRGRAAALSEEMSRPDFWDDQEEARTLSAESARVEGRLRLLDGLRARVSDAEELVELAEGDEAILVEVAEELGSVEKALEEQEVARLFSGPYDEGAAILTINSGAGGVEAQDWAEMLARMYRRWAERRGYSLEAIEYTLGDEAGIKSATYSVAGEYAFGLLSAERGVHRLVRVSPFDAQGRRHTSFASVAVAPVVSDTVEVEIDEKDLKVDTYRASGAGGQHVNKTDSAVRITHLPTEPRGGDAGPQSPALRARAGEAGERARRGGRRTGGHRVGEPDSLLRPPPLQDDQGSPHRRGDGERGPHPRRRPRRLYLRLPQEPGRSLGSLFRALPTLLAVALLLCAVALISTYTLLPPLLKNLVAGDPLGRLG